MKIALSKKIAAILFLILFVPGCTTSIKSDSAFARNAPINGEIHFLRNSGGWKKVEFGDLLNDTVERVLLDRKNSNIIVLFDSIGNKWSLGCVKSRNKRTSQFGYHPCNSAFFTINAPKTTALQTTAAGITLGGYTLVQTLTGKFEYVVEFNQDILINALKSAGLVKSTSWSAKYTFVDNVWIAQRNEIMKATKPTAAHLNLLRRQTDTYVCRNALTQQNQQLNWDSRNLFSDQVREAKRRGLTLERCAQLTGRSHQVAGSTEPPSSDVTEYPKSSDMMVCVRALTAGYEPLGWGKYEDAVQEAKRRGHTLERCAQLTGRKTQVARNTTPSVRVSPPPPPPVQSSPRTVPRHLVMAVQKRLVDLGFDPGPADGVVGGKTRSAIRAFQRLANLDATGDVSADLLQRLKRETAAIAKPTPTVQPPATPEPAQTVHIPAGIDFGRYHALVIGNNAYRTLPRLRTAVNDAKGVANLLREAYGFKVTVLTDASRDDTIKTLYGIRSRLKERDNLLIYYAGHGWLDEKADRGYWFPVDATEDNPSRWLSNADITDTLKAVNAKHVLVVADSCYSGAMARAFHRGALIKPRTSSFIAQMLDKKSRTVLASGGMEPVVDSGGGRHSVFAKALLDALADNRGVIDGMQVFARVREQVRLNAHQTPQYSNIRFAGHEVGGDFLFVRRR